jgi:hypothetical protein
MEPQENKAMVKTKRTIASNPSWKKLVWTQDSAREARWLVFRNF